MVQKLPVFKKFCCCIPLRLGVFIVGYWSIFSKLFLIWFNIRIMASMTMETASNGAGVSKLLARAYMFRSLNIIVLLVYIVLSVMLVIGVRKKKPEYLRHFFVSCLVMTVVDLVVMGFAIIILHHWMFAFILCWTATNIYSLVIVRSFFLSMEEKERGPRPRSCEPQGEVCWDTMQLAHV